MKKKLFVCVGMAAAISLTGCSLPFSLHKNKEKQSEEPVDDLVDASMYDDSFDDEYTDDLVNDWSESTETLVAGLGESVIISVSNPDTKEKLKVECSVDSIVRGDEAQSIVNEYNNLTEQNKIADIANPNLEFAVVSYTIKVSEGEVSENTAVGIGCSVDEIVYNGKLYSGGGSRYVETDNSYLTTEQYSIGRYIFTLPVGCVDYSVTLGKSEDFPGISVRGV